MVVTIDDVAVAIVEITSSASVPGFVFASSRELRTHGSLRFVMIPVTN